MSKTLSPGHLARYGPDDGTCPQCGKTCGPNDRYPGKRICKACRIKSEAERYARIFSTPEGKAMLRERARHQARKNKYGITRARYEAMVEAQAGRCGSCGDEAALVVDHDHTCCAGVKTCGECIRGLVCADCNKVFGFARDSVERLEKAAAYLRACR